MKRITTTLLAASALAISATFASACPFSKNDVSAQNDIMGSSMKSAKASSVKIDTTLSDSLATNDTPADKAVTPGE